MAARSLHTFEGRVVICCLYLTASLVLGQEHISSGSRYYNRDGVYVPQDANGYRTYVYKDRRYGYQPSYLDPIYRGPTRSPEDRYLYDVSWKIYYLYVYDINLGDIKKLFFFYKNLGLKRIFM